MNTFYGIFQNVSRSGIEPFINDPSQSEPCNLLPELGLIRGAAHHLIMFPSIFMFILMFHKFYRFPKVFLSWIFVVF